MSGIGKRALVTSTVISALVGSGLAIAPNAEAATSLKAEAYSTATAQKGDWYKWGAAGPSRFDCSGLLYYSFRKHGKDIPRVAASQYNYSKHISKSSRTKGDLVFFYGSGGIYHVGFYAGNGYILHAPHTGAKVRIEKIWTSSVKYGRIG